MPEGDAVLIVQRGDQKIDYPAMIGWGLVFFLLFGGFTFLTAHVVMRPQRASKLPREAKAGQSDQAGTSDDYWSRG